MNLLDGFHSIQEYLDRRPRLTLLIFSILILIAWLYYCYWVGWRGYLGEAEQFNFAYADAIFNGVAPFTPYGDLRWEYPPLAYLTFLLPRLVTDDPHTYVFVFGLQTAIVCIIGAALMMRIARSAGRSPVPFLLIYVACILSLNYFIFDRFDMVVVVLVLGAICLYMERRYEWAVVLIILGMFIKLYPAVILPLFLIPLLHEHEYRRTVWLIAFGVALSVAIMVPFLLMAPDNAWNFLTYHTDRGLQIESVASSIILMLELLGLTSVEWDFSFGSYNIHGGLADAVVPLMLPLTVIALVSAYVLFFMWCKGNRDRMTEGVVGASVLAVMLFIIFNKVFSAQYVDWITLPMLAACLYMVGGRMPRMLLAVLAMDILTYAMVKTSADLMTVDPIGITLLFVRNVLVIAMAVSLCRGMSLGGGAAEGFRTYFPADGEKARDRRARRYIIYVSCAPRSGCLL